MRGKKNSLRSSGDTKIKNLINQGKIKNKITSFISLGERRVVNSYFL